jgi:hypothetical protein
LIQLSHGIKLYPPGSAPQSVLTDTETPVVAEKYDEVVFTDPHESFFLQLQSIANLPTISTQYREHAWFPTYSDFGTFQALLEAKKYLEQALKDVKKRQILVDNDLEEVEEVLKNQVEKNKVAAAAKNAVPASRAAISSSSTNNVKKSSGVATTTINPSTVNGNKSSPVVGKTKKSTAVGNSANEPANANVSGIKRAKANATLLTQPAKKAKSVINRPLIAPSASTSQSTTSDQTLLPKNPADSTPSTVFSSSSIPANPSDANLPLASVNETKPTTSVSN